MPTAKNAPLRSRPEGPVCKLKSLGQRPRGVGRHRRRSMSATETKGMALVTGASAGIGAIYAAAKVASLLAGRAENALLSAPILPSLLQLTLPNLAAMLVVALAAIFETVYVGILGTTSLAAIALVFPLIMLMRMPSGGSDGRRRLLGDQPGARSRRPCTAR